MCEDAAAHSINPVVARIARILDRLGVKVYLIGARSVAVWGLDLGRSTRDWDVTIDKPFTRELRDIITGELRKAGFKVQWRKWGFLVENGVHVDINYAPLTLDEEFKARSMKIGENIFLPSIEDIIVLKLASGERKDLRDVRKILAQAWEKLDKDYLLRRACEAGLEKELKKQVKRLGLEI